MQLFFTNTLSGKKEEFVPLEKGVVKMYCCGPTVYDYLHIGNLRTFVTNDLLRRTFEANGFKVQHVMNVTDVDDKMIRGAEKEQLPLAEFAKKYETFFLKDLKSLNVEVPTSMPHATQYIPEMITMIQELIDKEFAYVADDGVYFSIEKSKDYGKIANIDLRKELRERIQNDEYEKENAQDFALWKFTKEGETVFWDAPFGKGRPGWHIECSAMSRKELGPRLDVHTGGIDLLFPHHTNEIAQSEAASGARFASFWIHGGLLEIGEAKMSKSKGNFWQLQRLIDEKIHPLSYRYYLLGANYRTPMNFSLEAVVAAETALENILRQVATLILSRNKKGITDKFFTEKFAAAVNDDLNTPKALAILHEVLGSSLDPADKLATIEDMDKVLGLNLIYLAKKIAEIPEEITDLNDERNRERLNKNWQRSDALRKEIEAEGFNVFDQANGSLVERKLSSLI